MLADEECTTGGENDKGFCIELYKNQGSGSRHGHIYLIMSKTQRPTEKFRGLKYLSSFSVMSSPIYSSLLQLARYRRDACRDLSRYKSKVSTTCRIKSKWKKYIYVYICDRAWYMKMTRGTNLMQQLWFIIINNSICFGHLYVHLQEFRLCTVACGVQH